MVTNSTTNIRRHLIYAHGKIELGYKSQLAARESVSIDKKRLLDDAVIQCIVMDGRSWGDFRRNGMQKFLKIATPGYSGPCSRTVQRRLTKLYIKKKEEFKKELSKISSVSITTDMWRSKNNRHFVCVTVHSMDEKFICRSYVLSFKKFHGRCIAKKLHSHLVQILKDLNLLGKITTTTTDNDHVTNFQFVTRFRESFSSELNAFVRVQNATFSTVHTR